MKTISRKHHYVPQSYLAAFTDTKKKTGCFYVFDFTRHKNFKTSPANVASQRDFNMLEEDGVPSDIVENQFSVFEGSVISAFKEVNLNFQFPTGDKLNDILNMMCLLAVRNPKLRKQFNEFQEISHNMMADLLVQNGDIYSKVIAGAKKNGYIQNDEKGTEFRMMRDFVTKRRYTLEFPPERNLVAEIRLFDVVLKLLGKRYWSLLVAPFFCPDFICSDHPVVLVNKAKTQRVPCGYGSLQTEIFFPIGPRICLYGVFENALKLIMTSNLRTIAEINSNIIYNAESCIFSRNKTFHALVGDKITEITHAS